MVVFTVAEDIEAKIRRLRELGKATAEPETPSAPVPGPAPKARPPRRPRRLGSIRERERKKRIIIGASVLILIILVASLGVYVWYSNRAKEELRNAKLQKIHELNSYFKGPIMNTSYGKATYQELYSRINAARSKEEVQRIDVVSAYKKVLTRYQQELAKKKAEEEQKMLNEAKANKKAEINLLFQSLLAQPLPDQLKNQVLEVKNSLIQDVENATSVSEVKAINAVPYLTQLWRDYYSYKIDSVKGKYVVLEFNGRKTIYSKEDAKAYISGIPNYTTLMMYTVEPVKFVKIAVLLTRERVVGGFIEPNSTVMIFAKNGTKNYMKIADMGHVDMVLLPSDAGIINLNEQQGSSSSSSSTSNSQESSNQQSSASAGQTSVNQGGSSSSSESSSSSYSESSSATSYYSVNLGEIMRAISSGKIAGSADTIKQLQNYGDNLLALEEKLQLQNVPNGVPFLVIVEVPSVYVPDVLSHMDSLYIGEVVGES